MKSQSSFSPQLAGRAKQLFFRPEFPGQEYECVPYFYVEARIDYADVRTGHCITLGIHDLLEVDRLDDELVWTRDMVRPVDPNFLQVTRPEGAKVPSLPPHINEEALARIESQYIQFLLRHAESRVLRNYDLNLYSSPGETAAEFLARCVDLLNEPFRNELDTIREITNRRLERIEEKFLKGDRPGEFESDRLRTQSKSRLHEVAENIAQLFIKTELTLDEVGLIELTFPDAHLPELEEALEALVTDVRRDLLRLLHAYQDRVRNVDEYIVHPNLKDLHLVRTCIVWMPAKVQRA